MPYERGGKTSQSMPSGFRALNDDFLKVYDGEKGHTLQTTTGTLKAVKENSNRLV